MKALQCECGTRAFVASRVTRALCPSCGKMIEGVEGDTSDEGDDSPARDHDRRSMLGTAETVPALRAVTESGAPVRPPKPHAPERRGTSKPAKRARWWLPLVGGIVLGGALVAFIAPRMRETDDDRHGVVENVPVDAAVPVPIQLPPRPTKPPASPQLLVAAEHSAIARADESDLLGLVHPSAFAFGVDATQVAYGGPAVAATIIKDVGHAPEGHAVSAARTVIGTADDVAWIASELVVDKQTFMTTQLAVRRNDVWSVAAWHWAKLVPNGKAAALAKKGQLPTPAALRDGGDNTVRALFAKAFTSRKDQVDFLATRTDVVDIGSAPGERYIGSAAIRRWIESGTAKLGIHDGISIGMVTPRAAWGAANIDFTITVKSVPLTQTFRVLAAFVDDGSGWKIVLIHWSNGGPI